MTSYSTLYFVISHDDRAQTQHPKKPIRQNEVKPRRAAENGLDTQDPPTPSQEKSAAIRARQAAMRFTSRFSLGLGPLKAAQLSKAKRRSIRRGLWRYLYEGSQCSKRDNDIPQMSASQISVAAGALSSCRGLTFVRVEPGHGYTQARRASGLGDRWHVNTPWEAKHQVPGKAGGWLLMVPPRVQCDST